MNFRSCIIWFIVLILCSSSYAISVDVKSSKCFPQCMSYCVNEKESGIPSSLCNNVCTASCYSGRRDLGNVNMNLEDNQ